MTKMVIFTKKERAEIRPYVDQLTNLYISCFISGNAGWGMAPHKVSAYMQRFEQNGLAIIALDRDIVAGGLLAAPVAFDPDMPAAVTEQIVPETSKYIAEVMVSAQYRGRGIGKGLLLSFEQQTAPATNTAIIRVWNKNTTAMSIYERAGFIRAAQIVQQKKTLDDDDRFDMKKTYLIKRYAL